MADKLLQDQHAVIRYAINKVTQLRKPAENSEVPQSQVAKCKYLHISFD